MKMDAYKQERQVALYDYLLSRGDRWTSMEQVTDSISYYPAFFTGYYHNSAARRVLTRDINEINSSDTYFKIIISCNDGIKIATEEEAYRFLKSESREIFKKLKSVRKMMRKASRDQQIDLEGRIAEAFLQDANAK